MIAPILLAAALAGAPGPAAAAPSPSARNERLDFPVTLALKEASLVDILEKLADLLEVTPIFEPGLGGRLSLELRGVPAEKALEMVGRAAKVEISLRGRVMRVRPSAGARPAPAAPPARGSLAFGEVARFWIEGAEDRPLDVRVPEFVGHVDLPGCAERVTVARLGPAPGPARALALAVRPSPGARSSARVLDGGDAEGARLLLPGCDGRLVVAAGGALSPGAIAPTPVRDRLPLVASVRVLEVTEEGDESLSEPRVGFSSGAGFRVASHVARDEARSVFEDVEVSGACLEVEPERGAALLAVSAGLSRGPADGGAPRTLVARRAESLWLSLGRPVRWTVDSSWDGGRAAIVVELTLLRLGEAPR